MIAISEIPKKACYHRRLLELRTRQGRRAAFWHTRRSRAVPDFFVWKRCRRFVPRKSPRA